MEFREGQEVWVYDPPFARKAVIRVVLPVMSYHCTFENASYRDNELVCEYKLFARPSEWSELVDQLRDDAETLNAAADKLELDSRNDADVHDDWDRR